MSQALTFNNVTLAPIPHQNSLWIRSVELARALGYSDESSVGRIYKRNAEEFTPEMTQVIEISDTVNLTVPARIFSLRGCHLVAMFARTPVAKAFRRWVLDVLDKLDAEQRAASPSPTPDGFTGPLSLTPSSVADRKPLRALVGSWAQVSGLPFAACWNQLKAAFQLANIKELPQEWIPDALAWVQARIDALPKALPPQPERLPLYRNGAFHLPPANNPAHKPGPQEEALMALWKEWGSRTRELEQLFNSLSRDLDACRGKTFAYAISDLGRHADTAFSTDAMLEGLHASQDTACDLFRQALHSMSRQLLLSLNVAVAMGR
ncbi:BRO family protein [uncultured Desulfovibrio sp.]|mgnify:CR=1 FL=1|uniref:BRO-N domain-containing protein n=2 Tax=Desulfovibrio TaxID=872 RepID=UPI0026369039|nr:BRO family protein [uncultured Desulfovibrio sp.]